MHSVAEIHGPKLLKTSKLWNYVYTLFDFAFSINANTCSDSNRLIKYKWLKNEQIRILTKMIIDQNLSPDKPQHYSTNFATKYLSLKKEKTI